MFRLALLFKFPSTSVVVFPLTTISPVLVSESVGGRELKEEEEKEELKQEIRKGNFKLKKGEEKVERTLQRENSQVPNLEKQIFLKELGRLYEISFKDVTLNTILLFQYKGDVLRVVKSLLS